MNPCPCGEFGVAGGTCTCSPAEVRRYAGKISGPLLDRVDIDLRLQRVVRLDAEAAPTLTTTAARERVREARERAARRLQDTPWRTNADVSGPWLRNGPYALSGTPRQSLDAALNNGMLTLRSYDRVTRVAWTVADLAGHDAPDALDVGRALFLKKGVSQ